MIKFWTFQSRYTMEELCRTGIYFPDFNKTCQYEGRLPAYNHILDIYKYQCLDINTRGRRLNGLVFGITSYFGKNIETYEEYSNAIFDFGASGISNCCDNVYVLELELPDDMFLLPIDFYRFADLIYYTGEELGTKQLNGIDLDEDIVKQDLFKPNGPKGEWELPQCHIPYIKRNQIKRIYPGVSFKCTPPRNLVYSRCDKIDYYRNRLRLTP